MPRTLSVLSIGSGQTGEVSQPQTSNTQGTTRRRTWKRHAMASTLKSQYTHVYMTESPSHCPGSTPLSWSPSANPALSIQHSPAQAACTSGPRYTIIHTLIVLNHRAAVRLCARFSMQEKPPDQAPSGEPSSCPPSPDPLSLFHSSFPRATAYRKSKA